MLLPADPGREVLDEVGETAHILAYVVIVRKFRVGDARAVLAERGLFDARVLLGAMPHILPKEDLPENPATAPAAPEEEPAPSESDPAAPPTEGTTPDGAKPEEPSEARRLPTTTPAPGRGTSTARATKPTPTTPSPSASLP